MHRLMHSKLTCSLFGRKNSDSRFANSQVTISKKKFWSPFGSRADVLQVKSLETDTQYQKKNANLLHNKTSLQATTEIHEYFPRFVNEVVNIPPCNLLPSELEDNDFYTKDKYYNHDSSLLLIHPRISVESLSSASASYYEKFSIHYHNWQLLAVEFGLMTLKKCILWNCYKADKLTTLISSHRSFAYNTLHPEIQQQNNQQKNLSNVNLKMHINNEDFFFKTDELLFLMSSCLQIVGAMIECNMFSKNSGNKNLIEDCRNLFFWIQTEMCNMSVEINPPPKCAFLMKYYTYLSDNFHIDTKHSLIFDKDDELKYRQNIKLRECVDVEIPVQTIYAQVVENIHKTFLLLKFLCVEEKSVKHNTIIANRHEQNKSLNYALLKECENKYQTSALLIEFASLHLEKSKCVSVYQQTFNNDAADVQNNSILSNTPNVANIFIDHNIDIDEYRSCQLQLRNMATHCLEMALFTRNLLIKSSSE